MFQHWGRNIGSRAVDSNPVLTPLYRNSGHTTVRQIFYLYTQNVVLPARWYLLCLSRHQRTIQITSFSMVNVVWACSFLRLNDLCESREELYFSTLPYTFPSRPQAMLIWQGNWTQQANHLHIKQRRNFFKNVSPSLPRSSTLHERMAHRFIYISFHIRTEAKELVRSESTASCTR